MIVAVPKESFPGERRVALVPRVAQSLIKRAGVSIRLEANAGLAAGFPDADYSAVGVEIVSSRAAAFEADVVLQVRAGGANPEAGTSDLALFRSGQTLIACLDPLSEPEAIRAIAGKGVDAFAMELMPRITRAQSMDVLSSMATVAGYHAVLVAAQELPSMFPMMMTAAGTIAPARVLIIGAGVAGLQAIATARRLGAVVQGYDIRPAVKEQVESLGARFVELQLEDEDAEDAGGYAKAKDADFYRRQQEAMAVVVGQQDVVITTAAVPGKRAPVLVTEAMVQGMSPGSVIVDLAAERGGNCALTQPGQTIVAHNVTIAGPLNIPSHVALDASQMYSKNLETFMRHLLDEGVLKVDLEDQITRDTLVTRGGDVVHARVRELLGLGEAAAEPASDPSPESPAEPTEPAT